MMRRLIANSMALALLLATSSVAAMPVPLSGLGRFAGWRENSLIGYGLVTGLAGSGDTRSSAVTRQSLKNVLSRLGTTVVDDQISSRNVAVVLVTAILPASANVGDRIDVNVSSIGDARSLSGGTLIMTPLLGPDQRTYALAQGQLLVGGYHFESNLNEQQRNFPTAAILPGGATIEAPVDATLLQQDGAVVFLLSEPNFATAQRIADAVNERLGTGLAWAAGADEVRIRFAGERSRLNGFLAEVSSVVVEPDMVPRVVVNERTGTVVAGGDVLISTVVIAQGDLKVTIKSEQVASQPNFVSGFVNDVRSLVITNTKLDVEQGAGDATLRFPNTTVADLVLGLHRAHVDTRRMISILQAVKSAGALHADIIVK